MTHASGSYFLDLRTDGSLGVAEVFLPGPEAGVALAARADAVAVAVGEQAERETHAEVVGPAHPVAGVGTGGGAGPPQEPRAHPPPVVALPPAPRGVRA